MKKTAVLCILLSLLLGCAIPTVSTNFYKNSIKYEPTPGTFTIPANALLEVRHTFAPEVVQLWKDWLNPEANMISWKTAVSEIITEDIIQSGLFSHTSLDSTARHDFLVLIESQESKPGPFRMTISLSVVNPETMAIVARYQRQADLGTGYLSYPALMKANLNLMMTEIKSQLIGDFKGQNVSSLLARRPIGAYSPSDAQASRTPVNSAAKSGPVAIKGAVLSRSPRQGTGPEGAPQTATKLESGGGLYALERRIAFNVLDKVVFDDQAGQVTLIGHYDSSFEGPRIPYLQHLATLLESTNPGFSLEWTRDSEARTDAFLRRMDSTEEMRKVVENWMGLIGADGKVSPQGRIMLPLFGVKPTENGKGPGYLGVQVKLIKPQSYGCRLPIIRIAPGSPAQKAGLMVGDEILFIGNQKPYHPIEVERFVRRTGAGASTKIRIARPGAGEKVVPVKLGTGSGDEWNDLSRFDMLVQIFKAAEMRSVSWLLHEYNRLQYLIDTPVGEMVLWDVVISAGQYNNVRQMQNQVSRGVMSRYQFKEQLFRCMLAGTDRILKSTRLTPIYDSAIGQGYSPEDAWDRAYLNLNHQITPSLRQAQLRLLKKQDQIVMPLSMVRSTLGMTPMVVPTYYGVDQNSQLARVMFEADYLGKFTTNMPGLQNKVPGYLTEYAYFRQNGASGGASGSGSAHQYRMWISVDSIDMLQSLEGNTLEIRDLKMRFNIRDAGGGKTAPAVGGYERLLTSLYDDFSREFHVLHELREAAKLAAASRWIKSKRPDFSLPREGRLRWQGPDRVPGVVNLIWSPNHVRVSITAMGGVSLVPPIGPPVPESGKAPLPVARDASVVELKGTRLVEPQRYDNPTLRRILRKKTVVPVPRPPGWVARATKGERTLQALTVRDPADSGCDAAQSLALSRKLEQAKKKAEQLKVVEDSINRINSKSPDRQKEFAAVNAMATEARDEFIKNLIDTLTQGFSGTYDILKKDMKVTDFKTMQQGVELMEAAQSAVGEIKGKIDKIDLAYRIAAADDIESRNKAIRDLVALTKELMSDAKFTGNDRLSRALRKASKSLGKISIIGDAVSLGNNLIDLGEGIIRVEDADKLTEQELRDFTNRLLPMQRRLSLELDQTLKDPAVQDWLSNRSDLNC